MSQRPFLWRIWLPRLPRQVREAAGGGDQEVLQDRGGEGVRDQDQDLHQDHRLRGHRLQGGRVQGTRQVTFKISRAKSC